MGKKISFSLSESSIDAAIKELDAYKQDFLKKVETLRNKIAERIAAYAQEGFNGAIVDDIIDGSPREAEVDVSFNDRGGMTVVVAKGVDAIWVEFGAGVYHNGSTGTSPHPYGPELGFIIGGYGKGKGKRKVWGYKDDSNQLVLTHGTPAKMPLMKAVLSVSNDIPDLVREVFG
jgi:hypothetical protein